jgi:alginate O-acetyltransferase complex protein AlgI
VVVDRVFETPTRYNAPTIVFAAAMFLTQVYCDFNGYSTMARGLGWMFGFRLPRNFDYPLLRWNPLLYRKSWHITMGNWFQDYVYRPLGGSTVSDARFAFNLFITWLLLGLWHGASWHFVAWGVSNGIQLAVYLVVLRRKTWALPDFTGKRFCGWLINFSFWIPGAIFFRAQSLREAGTLLKRMFTGAGGFGVAWQWYALTALLGGIHLLSFLYYRENLLERSGWPARVALVSGTALLIATFGATGRTFIYFQF